MALTFVITLGYAALRSLWYVLNSILGGRSLHMTVVFAIAIVSFAAGLTVFTLLSRFYLLDLQRIIGRFRTLANRKRNAEFVRIPIVSRYETGELVSVFNALQGRYEKEYEQWNKDLKLALSVQQKLLNTDTLEDGAWQISAARALSAEVGGGLFDIARTEQGNLLVMAGTVNGNGMPAALVMSAVLTLFRAHARESAEPARLLTSLNRKLSEMLGKDDPKVCMGIGLINTRENALAFASAGAVQAVVVHGGLRQSLRSAGGPPLSEVPDAEYTESIAPLAKGCRLLLCSLPPDYRHVPDLAARMAAHADRPFHQWQRLIALEVGGRGGDNPDMAFLSAHWREERSA
ncbi:hypothetical protein SD70_11405 [Gordoniibacillus kamchatkensis]|uniref:PPM-type phosphatase domain-containing protein n=2 Tax=Gordoniibacillus kamchatkensis TaxID=1590651 RepID=A0ABR5AIG7_9BACL|nr:hypothetical protein SD70_11405 [Paenibacillus sp. VKM B-2647]